MGYTRHHAIVVTSWNSAAIEEAHITACAIFGNAPTAVTVKATNGYRSFLIPPDGSKEGWEESDEGDQRRARFKAWLRTKAYDDGSTSLPWVEVQFGDDERETKVVDDSDRDRRR